MIKLGLLWYGVYPDIASLSVSILHTEKMGLGLPGDEVNI